MNEEEFMSDIKDEISVNIDTAAKSVDMIKDYTIENTNVTKTELNTE